MTGGVGNNKVLYLLEGAHWVILMRIFTEKQGRGLARGSSRNFRAIALIGGSTGQKIARPWKIVSEEAVNPVLFFTRSKKKKKDWQISGRSKGSIPEAIQDAYSIAPLTAGPREKTRLGMQNNQGMPAGTGGSGSTSGERF